MESLSLGLARLLVRIVWSYGIVEGYFIRLLGIGCPWLLVLLLLALRLLLLIGLPLPILLPCLMLGLRLS